MSERSEQQSKPSKPSGRSKAKQSKAKQGKAKQRKEKPSKANQSKPKPKPKPKQSKAGKAKPSKPKKLSKPKTGKNDSTTQPRATNVFTFSELPYIYISYRTSEGQKTRDIADADTDADAAPRKGVMDGTAVHVHTLVWPASTYTYTTTHTAVYDNHFFTPWFTTLPTMKCRF